MRRIKLITLSALACFLLQQVPVLHAQETKPIGVVSIAGYDKVIGEAAKLGKIVGVPLDKLLEGQIAEVAGGKLEGIDKTKPWAIQITLDGEEPQAVACIPVTDLDKLLDSLAEIAGKPEDVGDGIKSLPEAPEPTFIKSKDGWAFIAEDKAQLADLPADPIKLVGDLPGKYLVGARLWLQHVPAEMRNQMSEQLQALSELQLEGAVGDDEEIALQRTVIKKQMASLKQTVDELDEVTIGVGLDDAAKKLLLEVSATAVSESETAKAWNKYKQGTSAHSGLLAKDAAMTMLASYRGGRPEEELALLALQHKSARARTLRQIDDEEGIPDELKGTLKDSLGKLIDVAFDTLKADEFDVGMALFVEPKFTLVAGGRVSDPAAVQDSIKKMAKAFSELEEVPPINWDAEKHQGYTFHKVSVPVPAPEAAELLGEEVEMVLAVAADSCYLAAGGNSTAQLKKIIDASAAGKDNSVKMAEFVLKLGDIAGSLREQDITGMAAMMADMLKDNGRIVMSGEVVPNGMVARIEIEENVLKALGLAGRLFGGGAGGPPPGFGPPGAAPRPDADTPLRRVP